MKVGHPKVTKYPSDDSPHKRPPQNVWPSKKKILSPRNLEIKNIPSPFKEALDSRHFKRSEGWFKYFVDKSFLKVVQMNSNWEGTVINIKKLTIENKKTIDNNKLQNFKTSIKFESITQINISMSTTIYILINI